MTERERLPEDGAEPRPHNLAGRIEEELREPIVEEREHDLPDAAAERVNWRLVIGLVIAVGVGAAVIYGLLIFWSAT